MYVIGPEIRAQGITLIEVIFADLAQQQPANVCVNPVVVKTTYHIAAT